ncbi:putative acetyl xylan esterase [Actinacidiphila reveromycinica]|uniref:Putative acetyl xylan esterase n=1 Tax=Actinacidiphila reveromycinica TaxID=659352 RepID=A0A7U3WGX5_9ACTN|nr:acetylxylan esterase [Streptomyces sp. SN-593]BBA95640.1 putative acetyl xylan esterase [Streptomyces sp. SN-593]
MARRPMPPRTHPYPFDPTYGHDLDALTAVPGPDNEPDDFAAFWRDLYERCREVRVDARIEERLDDGWRRGAGPDDGSAGGGAPDGPALVAYRISYTSLGGVRLGGWLTLPADAEPSRAAVVAHGYGGRAAPDPRLPIDGVAAVQPCLRGLPALSEMPDIGTPHVLQGIASRGTYVHGGCAADVWCAVTALHELVPATRSLRLDFQGTSFGGGIGALALPWDERFTSGQLTVPSFGNHLLRVGLECLGSGSHVRERYLCDPSVLDVVAYFDAATAARHLRIPVHVGAALFDAYVPPPGQFAVFNNLAGPKELYVMPFGHYFDHPDDAAQHALLRSAIRAFFARTAP